MSNEVSGLVALQFGQELTAAVGATPVDLYCPQTATTMPGVPVIAVPMPQSGCVRAISVKFETGVAAGKAATLAATKGGTEDTVAVKALAAGDTKGYASFDNNDMVFNAGDEIGISLTGDAVDAIAVQGVHAIVFTQFGRSNI